VTPPAPVWAEVDRVGEEMLWDRFDAALTARALARVAAGAGWLILAAVNGVPVRWGVPMLFGSGLALLHARRPQVMALADASGVFSPAIRWLLPYPRTPHVNAVGLIEALAVALAAIGTGWIGGAFTPSATARAAAPVATALIMLVSLGITLNHTSHLAWELDPAAAFYRWLRPLIAPLMGGATMVLLWPSDRLGEAYRAAATVVVTGGVTLVCAAFFAQYALAPATARLVGRTRGIRAAVQAVDARHVHQLKNLARILYLRSDEIADSELRERVRRLSVAISATEQLLKAGGGLPIQGVQEVLDGFLGLDERFARLRHIDADLDPRDLTPGDAELISIAAGDLCSNAVNAQASSFTIGLRSQEAPSGNWLVLQAHCVCGKPLPDIPEDSSLMRLAGLLHSNGGSFVITEKEGQHTFELRWPTSSTPRARPLPDGSPDPRRP
jgi:hypothetical protein